MNKKACIQNIVDQAVKFIPEEEQDYHRNTPVPDPECLYALVGDVARAGSENTEANPYAIAAAFMTYLSAAIGRGPYLTIGDDWHHARLFTLHVGRSGIGRKGTATKPPLRIAKAVQQIDERLSPQIHRGGLSTREGLALMIHDGWTHGKEEVPAILDKRLWVLESEFSNVLHQGKRDGNTLSAALRDCWDGTSIKPAIKTNKVWATDPHVNLTGNITPSELRGLMHERELSNGFTNRFLIFWAEQSKVLAFPQATPQHIVDTLARRVVEVLRFTGADQYNGKDMLEVRLSTGQGGAAKLYADLYHSELRDRSGGERITGLLERRVAMLLRLAMLFALTDCMTEIQEKHLRAALAWIRYWTDSVKFIFQSGIEEVETAQTYETAEKVLAFLKLKGQATRTQLTVDCFQSHLSKTQINAALDELLTTTPPRIWVETMPRPKGMPGTPTKIYRLKPANSANRANSNPFQGFMADLHASELRKPSELIPD